VGNLLRPEAKDLLRDNRLCGSVDSGRTVIRYERGSVVHRRAGLRIAVGKGPLLPYQQAIDIQQDQKCNL
jgi:hypothetical protein